MSHNQPAHPKVIVSDSFYEILASRRAQDNERLAAQGLPPRADEPSYISESQARAEAEAEAKRRAAESAAHEAASLAPPPPTRGPLCRAAKAKLAERIASIPGFERHSRKCQICRSPYVEHIETLYLQWESAQHIRRYFQLEDADTVYRHARAAGLDVARRQNVRVVVEQFIEQWRSVKITSSTIIRSIRALSCLDDKGRWTEPPKTHILLRGDGPRSSDSGLPKQAAGSTERTTLRENGFSPLSIERSEPHSRRNSGEQQSESSIGGPSTERSDPLHENATGLPDAGNVSSTHICGTTAPASFEPCEPGKRNCGLAETGSAAASHTATAEKRSSFASDSSSERSEPHENSSPESRNTRASRRSNRVSMGN